jgi:hypothetical protein
MKMLSIIKMIFEMVDDLDKLYGAINERQYMKTEKVYKLTLCDYERTRTF